MADLRTIAALWDECALLGSAPSRHCLCLALPLHVRNTTNCEQAN